MSSVYIIGLGSSHPCSEHYLQRALSEIKNIDQIRIISVTDFQRSAGIGTDDALTFQNGASCVESCFGPSTLWFELRSIESRLGRIRTQVNAPRTIDLDILWWSRGQFQDTWITTPHPRLHERRFAIDLARKALNEARIDSSALKVKAP